MTIKDLIELFDNIDEFTRFYCYDNGIEYIVSGHYFANLNKSQLLLNYGDSKVKKFYIDQNFDFDIFFDN